MRAFFQACGEAAVAGTPAKTVPDAHYERIGIGARKFLRAVSKAPELEYRPNIVPVAENWADSGTDIGKQFAQVSDHMPWCPGRGDPQGTKRGLIFINDMFGLEDVRAGLLYVGENEAYPEHSHSPQEMYIMLDGTSEWRFGGNSNYSAVPPGHTIYNNPLDIHGVRAGKASLSMWVLWGEGI